MRNKRFISKRSKSTHMAMDGPKKLSQFYSLLVGPDNPTSEVLVENVGRLSKSNKP